MAVTLILPFIINQEVLFYKPRILFYSHDTYQGMDPGEIQSAINKFGM